jgi:uncharacterized protein
MNRPIQFLLFLAVALGVTAALHYYIWLRLVRDPALSGPARTAGTVLVWGLYALLAASLPLARALPRAVGSPLLWVAYTWMGALVILSMSLAVADLVRWSALRLIPPAEPERRLLLQRALSGLALGASGVLGAVAMRSAIGRVAVREVAVTLARLPAALSGLRIVQLTDLHIGPTIDGDWLRAVVTQVNALDADVVAITGDLVDGSVERLGPHVAALRDLRARHGVFFVTGNHEYYSGADRWIAELRRLGVRVLRNERVTITGAGGHALDLAGIDDHHSHGFAGHGPDLPRALAGRDPERPLVLLAHQPAAITEAAAHGVDLQLSGHTHGGQLWPWRYLVRLQQPYVDGLHRHPGGETQIYVSRGTGYWGPPMRLGAPAEITHITLRAA